MSDLTESLIDVTNQGIKPTRDDLVAMAGDLLGALCLAEGIPADFDATFFSAIRCEKTGQLQAIIISPGDVHNGEPFARYQVTMNSVAKPAEKSIILPG
jgi:hypothetical protein